MGVSCMFPVDSFLGSGLNSTRQNKRILHFVLFYFTLLCIACTLPAFGSADDNLMDLFTTTAFTGSWEVFSKFNFLGKIMNFFISFFCLIGIMLTCLRFVITLLYKSSPNLFDQVYDLKSKGKGQKLFGVPTMWREVFTGNYGTGADAFIGFALSLLPNFKAYSDYNPERMAYNLEEDDTITTYVLKISIPTIMTLFFFTIGFDGTLWQVYGNVVNAMAQVAKRGVEVNLAGYINKALSAGAMYSFSFNNDDLGKFQKSIASDIYNKVLLKMENLDTANMQYVGSKIEQEIRSNITADVLDSKFNTDEYTKKIAEDMSAAKNLSKSVVINTNSDEAVESTSCFVHSIPLSNFGVSGNWYAHIFITKKTNADETDYFKVNRSDSKRSDAPTSQTKKID